MTTNETDITTHFARVLAKRDLQGLLTAIRNSGSGATVQKRGGGGIDGYDVFSSDGNRIMYALNGSRGYLCRFHRDHFHGGA